MHTFAQKPNIATQQSVSAKSTLFNRTHQSSRVESSSSLQRTIGDQAVQQLAQDKTEEPETDLVAAPKAHFAHDFSQVLSLPPKTGQKTPAKLRSIEDVKYLEYGDINEPDKRNKKNI